MRTTLEIDGALLAHAQAQFPPGTPKTVIVEEGLRRLVAPRPTGVERRRDPRVQRLIDEGHLTPATATGPHVRTAPVAPIPSEVLLRDLAADREDR
ncbi:MAG: type II toxin-antitoxin system VapB family antitoxin [Deltaproteobacteria bacterium]|nr:type II toxin-antitoxin system VapB family antitoxin [Deltaproteobacteria bacterium]